LYFCEIWRLKKNFFFAKLEKKLIIWQNVVPKEKKTLDQGDIAKLPNCQIAKSTSLSGLPANEFQAAHNFIFSLGCPMPEFFSSL